MLQIQQKSDHRRFFIPLQRIVGQLAYPNYLIYRTLIFERKEKVFFSTVRTAIRLQFPQTIVSKIKPNEQTKEKEEKVSINISIIE